MVEIETVKAIDGKNYKVFNGVYYSAETTDDIILLLDKLRREGTRVRFRCYWGNAETGEDWNEVYDVVGTIGLSTGTIKIPLLIHNQRSLGGSGILTYCIVKIETSKGKRLIYQHPNYHLKEEKQKRSLITRIKELFK